MSDRQLTIEEAQYIQKVYLPIPHLFIKDVLGCNTWYVQDKIAQSVFENKLTAVKTCNAIGKSYIAARIVITYLTLHPGSIVVTTAPTWRQVVDVLWREIGTAVKQAKYKLTDKEVNQAGLNLATDWFAVGLSTKRPENFFGYHADHILVVVDEAGGVEEQIYRGVVAITPNANARVLLIGNPTTPQGTFYDAFTKPELGYKCFTVSAFDTPNFTANEIRNTDDLLRIFTPPEGMSQVAHNKIANSKLKQPFPNLIDPAVVYGRYHELGTDSPAWESLIMGEFPTQADQALIPTNLVTMAMNMYKRDDSTDMSYAELSGWKIPDGNAAVGQDMARFGSDSNVLTPRRGGWVDKQATWSKVDLMESADRILKHVDPYDPTLALNIDDTGNGGGTTDRLRQINRERQTQGLPGYTYRINAYNFSSKEFMSDAEKDKFHDITSMLYWNLRAQFYKKQIALHYDKQLFDELVSRRWMIVPGGKIKVESKDDYKKRTGGKSPDKCLIAGTKILTNKGYVSIENIRKGDKVVTPYGTRKVLDAGMTSPSARVMTIHYSNGTQLTATPAHKMITTDGLCTTDTLALYNEVYTDSLRNLLQWRTRNLLNITARSTGFRQQIEDTTLPNSTVKTASVSNNSSTGLYGNMKTINPYQRATLFITSTITLLTTPLITLRSWNEKHTANTIWQSGIGKTKRKVRLHWTRLDRSLKFGMLHQRARSGINNIAMKLGLTGLSIPLHANSVIHSTSPHSQAEQGFVAANVFSHLRANQDTTKHLNNLAYSAKKHLWQIDTGQRSVVVERVTTDTLQQSVYNLTVETDNVYFANGVLVSNCDSLALAFAPRTTGSWNDVDLAKPTGKQHEVYEQPAAQPITSGLRDMNF